MIDIIKAFALMTYLIVLKMILFVGRGRQLRVKIGLIFKFENLLMNMVFGSVF